jgi:hypothetical protein
MLLDREVRGRFVPCPTKIEQISLCTPFSDLSLSFALPDTHFLVDFPKKQGTSGRTRRSMTIEAGNGHPSIDLPECVLGQV